jgi:L-arabonate dehydrase
MRSADWFSGVSKTNFLHRTGLKGAGVPSRFFDGRPVIGICNTWSELTPCNAHLRELADFVRRGVLEAGGLPLEFPVMSLGETMMRPTTMLYRNMASMEVEETLRANPIDGVVLLSGCDKTTPAVVMGAASCDLPTIVVTGGPLLSGRFRGQTIGSGTSLFAMSEEVRAGEMPVEDFVEAEGCMSRSAGHCNTMGTASTMASMVEALGLSLPGSSAIPAADSRRKVWAQDSGRRIVDMTREQLRFSDVVSRASFRNAIRVLAAIGGSTNAVIHLLAIAGRAGVDLSLDDFDTVGRGIPLLVNLMPAGRFLMEDFYYAGGLPAVLRELGDLLEPDARTVSGLSLGEDVVNAPCWNREVIRELTNPLTEDAAIAVLRGSLAPDGAVIKPSAATPALLAHCGRAVVFESIEDLHARIDDPDLDVQEDSVLVLCGAGPKGYPGMPEVGNLPIPRKLLQRGIRDMVRVSDGRMSGTAYGTVVLHVSPESAAEGPLSLVRDGDLIELNVAERRIDLQVPQEELASRRQRLSGRVHAAPPGGYVELYRDHVTQADLGADFDFLVGRRGAAIPRESH